MVGFRVSKKVFIGLVVILILGQFCVTRAVEENENSRIQALEKQIAELAHQVQQLKEQKTKSQQNQQEQLEKFKQSISAMENKESPISFDKFSFGGYGEIHANFKENSGSDIIDFHRLVLYLGYDFAEWIKFYSEWELEHAFVSDDSGGEFLIEQAYFDFLLSDKLNVRAGKFLTPLGITNIRHEPTLFNGVERPSFDKYIIPSTWSSDGIGIFGQLDENLTYETYIVGGLDGSKFGETSGIRNGRIKERTSLNDIAYTGRIDYYPNLSTDNQTLRLGLSGYYGGLNNGNNGNVPEINSDISIYSGDFEYSIGKFDFRGALAHILLDNPEQLGSATSDVAKEIFGWYIEAGYHFWPEDWKTGKMKDSDAVFFVRYDNFDTQYKMPVGIAENPKGDRTEWTLGVNLHLTPNVVVKADYQISEDESDIDPGNKFNLGLGWTF